MFLALVVLYLLIGIGLVVFMDYWLERKNEPLAKWDEVALMIFAWPFVLGSIAWDCWRSK